MRMLLRAEFPNGPFGDPALYVRELNTRGALLFDCGDLSHFSTAQLHAVHSIFLSHCHIDHFAGFDTYLRLHVGMDKTTTIFGPPQTAERVAGKLQAYTWNLVHDQNMEFIAVELDSLARTRTAVTFHSRDGFRPGPAEIADWDPTSAILDTGYYKIHTRTLDHRTPSLAYSIEEKQTVGVDVDKLKRAGLKPGPWLSELKHHFLFPREAPTNMKVLDAANRVVERATAQLVSELLIPKQRHKLAYVTDGAASPENRAQLLELIDGADLLYAETCFTEHERSHAEETKHFTASFVGALAREAGVRTLAPFHFSKRYVDHPELVRAEARSSFRGSVLDL